MKTYPEMIAEGMKRTFFQEEQQTIEEKLDPKIKRDVESGLKKADRKGQDIDIDWIVQTISKTKKKVDFEELMEFIQSFENIPNAYSLEDELESELEDEDLLK